MGVCKIPALNKRLLGNQKLNNIRYALLPMILAYLTLHTLHIRPCCCVLYGINCLVLRVIFSADFCLCVCLCSELWKNGSLDVDAIWDGGSKDVQCRWGVE